MVHGGRDNDEEPRDKNHSFDPDTHEIAYNFENQNDESNVIDENDTNNGSYQHHSRGPHAQSCRNSLGSEMHDSTGSTLINTDTSDQSDASSLLSLENHKGLGVGRRDGIIRVKNANALEKGTEEFWEDEKDYLKNVHWKWRPNATAQHAMNFYTALASLSDAS